MLLVFPLLTVQIYWDSKRRRGEEGSGGEEGREGGRERRRGVGGGGQSELTLAVPEGSPGGGTNGRQTCLAGEEAGVRPRVEVLRVTDGSAQLSTLELICQNHSCCFCNLCPPTLEKLKTEQES